jgi:hypothetical protein
MATIHPAPTVVSFGEDVLERMALAVELVQERLRRATAALESAGVRYAVIGGNAVAAWVSRKDPTLIRNTVDVDLLVPRSEFEQVKTALAAAGFVYRHAAGIDMFLDGPKGSPREAVHVIFAGEKVRKEYVEAAPDLTRTDRHKTFSVLDLEPLVRMKLTSFRRKDQVHIQDMIEVGLLDASWVKRLPTELAARFQHLLDTPDG